MVACQEDGTVFYHGLWMLLQLTSKVAFGTDDDELREKCGWDGSRLSGIL